jgi:hypothetical protein
MLLLYGDESPMSSPKTWRARVTLLDWHLVKSLLGCILMLRAKQGAVFLFAKCLYVHWIEYALFPEIVCCNLTKIIFLSMACHSYGVYSMSVTLITAVVLIFLLK